MLHAFSANLVKVSKLRKFDQHDSHNDSFLRTEGVCMHEEQVIDRIGSERRASDGMVSERRKAIMYVNLLGSALMGNLCAVSWCRVN